MAEIRVNVTASKSQRVNVSSSNIATEITATPDTSQYYSNLSKNWAIAENIVDGKDYSSKHYAKEAQQASALANTYKEATEQAYISFSEQYANAETELTSIKEAGVQEINTAVTDGKTEITTTKDLAIDAVNNTKTTILQDIEFIADGEKKEIEDLIDNGKEELKESIDGIKVLTTLEIGDIGFTQMAIDESKGKRRVLNGQLIIQDQYVQFTNIVKESVALNPSLACTESEWQTAVTMSINGVCEKFVIDDEAGTIRLPKYPQYLDLTNNTSGTSAKTATVSVKGNGMVIGLTDGTNVGCLTNLTIDNNFGNQINVPVGTSVGVYGKTDRGIGVVTDATKSGLTGSVTIPAIAGVTSEKIKGQYFIQVATGAETEDNITNEIELNNPFSLLDYKYSEYELNNISWLRSNGQYNSKAVYPAVYDLLLKIYNGTETKAGVSVKLSTDGYTDYDFVLNTAEETFRLPVKVKLASGKAVVGNGMTLGVVGVVSNVESALAGSPSSDNIITYPNSIHNEGIGVIQDPTKSGIETSDSGLYLYFYVGETVQNANLINAGRIEEKVADIRAELPHKLNDNQITNCLLEVPQRIKLELNNGTLTLKAGSVVIVPNGFEADGTTPKFDYVTVESDKRLVVSDSSSTVSNSGWFVFYSTTHTSARNSHTSSNFSGATAPTLSSNYAVWYDTTNNVIKYTANKGTTWTTQGTALPLCSLTRTSGVATSIDQVFNGMGYIGSTIWVDKGVKGLIPNGRNEDGSLKNIEVTTTGISMQTFTTNTTTPGNGRMVIYDNGKVGGRIGTYDFVNNYNLASNGVTKITVVTIADNCIVENGIIKEINFKQPFRAVDYNDKSEIVSWGMPDYTAGVVAHAMGVSTTNTFTAQFDGYIYISAYLWSNSSYYITINGIKVDEYKGEWGGQTSQCFNFVGIVKRGDIIKTYYENSNTNSQNKSVRFFPMKGAK